ncbi:hypothetical protein TWF281_006494 [Arthrobotrys megalospora]
MEAGRRYPFKGGHSRAGSIAPAFETRAQKMKRMPRIISLHMKPSASHSRSNQNAWYCPQEKCRQKFDNEKDRNDHAHWHHAWCWKCGLDFTSQKALQIAYTFEKPSELLAHIEGHGCTVAATKGIYEHGMTHLILLDYCRDFTNEEKVYMASLDMKAIALPKDTIWLVDPLGKFYEVVGSDMQKITGESLFKYTWKIQGDEYNDISGNAKYTCLPCGEKYDQPRNFHEHIRGVEKKKKRVAAATAGMMQGGIFVVWKCEWCEAVFKVLSGLADHYEKGCKGLVDEMAALRKEREHWIELDEAMRREMIDEQMDLMYPDDRVERIRVDELEEDLGSVKSESSSDDSEKGEYTGGKTGLESMMSSLGIMGEEESDDDDWC